MSNRFKSTHVQNSHEWILEIRNVNEDDEGIYECQVNSEPRPASLAFYLHVSTATIDIKEGSIVNFEPGEQIKLTCVVDFGLGTQTSLETLKAPPTPHYVYWYKDGTSLDFNNQRQGIKTKLKTNATNLISWLTIEGAKLDDAGTYVCKIITINDLEPAAVNVRIGFGLPTAGNLDETELAKSSSSLSIYQQLDITTDHSNPTRALLPTSILIYSFIITFQRWIIEQTLHYCLLA